MTNYPAGGMPPFNPSPSTLSPATEKAPKTPFNPEGMPTTSWWHNSTIQRFNQFLSRRFRRYSQKKIRANPRDLRAE